MGLRAISGLSALLAVVVVAIVLIDGGGGAGAYRVDAIFDVARGIGPKQVVKVAGAQVGTVVAVRLTPTDQARVEMSIDRRFAPFRADASCRIEPEGLISENFVDCDPGSAPAPVLANRTGADRVPTVPVAHTTEPISLQDLFDIWSTPVSERLTVLLDELGISVSGRSTDIRAVLDRANPGLAEADRAIALVSQQRAQLQQIVTAAAPVVGQLAAHDDEVKAFLRQTAALTSVTAARRDALAQTIAHLPPLLSAARPALEQLDDVASDAPPLLEDLRRAAPALTRLTTTLPPVSASAVHTVNALSPALSATRGALSEATPTLGLLSRFATDADPAGEGLDRLLVSTRDSGAIESLLRGLYDGAALTSHYNADSHVIFADLLASPCMVYATTPSAACDAHLNGTATIPPGAVGPARAASPTASGSRTSTRSAPSGSAGGATSSPGASSGTGSSAAAGPGSTLLGALTGTSGPTGTTGTGGPVLQTVQHLLGFLLR